MNKLIDFYRGHTGKASDKWMLYLDVYDRIFAPYREAPVSLLEIGVQNGGSLEIWSKFFPNARKFVGCDIDPECIKLNYRDPKIKLVIGNANTDDTEKKIVKLSRDFDIIIDDGSHISSDIIRSFARYFPYLKDGGIFIAEDLHCSYWDEFEGGLYYPFSSMSFFKRLADIINHEHWGVKKERSLLLRGFSDHLGISFDDEMLSSIHSIMFINSICVLQKRTVESQYLGKRLIAGHEELVVHGNIKLSGSQSVALNQEDNFWSKIEKAPDEQYSKLKQQCTELKQTILKLDGEINKLNYANSETSEKLRILEQVNLSLTDSTSWRITKPLRIVGTKLKSIKHSSKITYWAVKKAGGFSSILKKLAVIYRKEGMYGIKRLISFYYAKNKLRATKGSGKFDRNDYAEWVRRYDTIDERKRNLISELCDKMTAKPLISVLMPTYNTNPEWLCKAIESVRNQIYTNWELCIADDASTKQSVREVLERYKKKDKRIKVVIKENNGHISAASNAALEIVCGEWIALLDHDDELPEHALFHVAQVINSKNEVRMIYSDEDKINDRGDRFDPYFKCDWNQDLFYSQNMFSHLGVYETKLVRKVGGFRLGYEGSQDYDLALRCIEHIQPTQIYHIPHVLYHWRVHTESTSMTNEAKPYAMIAGERALNDHFQRTGKKGSIKYIGCGYEPRYYLPKELPKVSIVIIHEKHTKLLKRCIQSILLKTDYSNFEIIVVNNHPKDFNEIQNFNKIFSTSKVRVVSGCDNANNSKLINYGVHQASGDLIVLLDYSAEVISNEWISTMVSHILREDIGAVGAKLWYRNNTIQHAGITLGIDGIAANTHKNMPKGEYGYFGRAALTHNVTAISKNCMVLRKSIFEKLNGFNEVELPEAYSDIDFCLRLRDEGYRIVWTPLAELYIDCEHEKNFAREECHKINQCEAIEYIKKKWNTILQNDPAYSPNLTINDLDFSLAWPPRINSI